MFNSGLVFAAVHIQNLVACEWNGENLPEGHGITSCCLAPRLCATTGGIVCLGERRQTALLLTTRQAASPFKNARGPTVRRIHFMDVCGRIESLWSAMNAQRKRTWGRKRKYRVALIGGSDVRCGAWLRICVFVYAVTLCTNTYKTKNKIRQFFLILIKKRYQPKEIHEFNLMLNILLFTCCCIVMLWNWLN